MKKLFFLFALIMAAGFTQVNAQQGDPAAMQQRYKERVKPQLIEKAKLTEAEADKVVEINFNSRSKMRGFRDLTEDERKKKMEEIQAEINKEYATIPLTEEKIKAVNEFFEEQRKQMQQRQNNGGN